MLQITLYLVKLEAKIRVASLEVNLLKVHNFKIISFANIVHKN